METEEDQSLDILVDLLANDDVDEAAVEERPAASTISNLPKYREISNPEDFLREIPAQPLRELHDNKTSEVHLGDTDSSEDEDNRYFEEQSYSEGGRTIRRLLQTSQPSSEGRKPTPNNSTWTTKKSPPTATSVDPPRSISAAPRLLSSNVDVFTEPASGIRIVNPLVSSASLREKMTGRQAVPMSSLKKFVESGQLSGDWVTIGVIIAVSPVKTSQKGSRYCIWRLSDLHGDLKSVSLFLFSGAYSAFWKTAAGAVVGVLNPSLMDKRDNQKSDDISLSIDQGQKLLILGKSKDLGFCKSKKKDGSNCTSHVNMASCEFCVYHAEKEYRRCTRGRSELQAPGGRGLDTLRNKVLGKNEVFYGGQSYSAVPAKASKKMQKKDTERLQSLGGSFQPMPGSSSGSSSGGFQSVVAPRLFEQRLRVAAKNEEALLSDKAGAGCSKLNFDQMRANATKPNTGQFKSKLASTDTTSKFDPAHKSGAPKSTPVLTKFDELDFDVPTQDTLQSPLPTSANDVRSSKSVPKSHSDRVASAGSKMKPKSPSLKPQSASKAKTPSSAVMSSKKTQNSDKSAKPCSSQSVPAETRIQTLKRSSVEVHSKNSPEFSRLAAAGTKPSSSKNSKPTDLEGGVSRTDMLARNDPEFSRISAAGISATPSSGISPDGSRKVSNPAEGPSCSRVAVPEVPVLKKFDTTDLELSLGNKRVKNAKMAALRFVQEKGPLPKGDPNSVRKRISAEWANSMKRKLGTPLPEDAAIEEKKRARAAATEARFTELLGVKSRHGDLLESAAQEAQDKYFEGLEVRERLEEKMLSTFKVDCKAVKCLQCKYLAFSSSDLCKREGHPIRVVDAVKRFFRCRECKARTVSLQVVPLHACKQCGLENWERAPMIREKQAHGAASLSICGNNEKLPSGQDANLNLLVPE